jgi:hypothetical protein
VGVTAFCPNCIRAAFGHAEPVGGKTENEWKQARTPGTDRSRSIAAFPLVLNVDDSLGATWSASRVRLARANEIAVGDANRGMVEFVFAIH